MSYLIFKVCQRLAGVATRVLGWLVMIFTAFFLIQTVWPKLVVQWKDAAEYDKAVSQAEDELDDAKAARKSLKGERDKIHHDFTSSASVIASLEQQIEVKIRELNEVNKREIEKLERNISERKSKTWFWTRWLSPAYVAETVRLQGELSARRLGAGDLPADLGNQYKMLKQKHDSLKKNLSDVEGQLANADDAVQTADQHLASLLGQESMVHALRATWLRFYPWIIPTVATLIVGPLLWKVFMFYPMAWLLTCQRPVKIEASGTKELQWNPPEKTAEVWLNPSEEIFVRSQWLVQHGEATKTTCFIWKLSAVATSFAAQLVLCTHVRNAGSHSISLALSSADPDEYVTEVCLEKESRVVIHPHRIIAVQGPITVNAHWRLTNLHSWLTGQVRYLVFSGPGRVYLSGCGGIEGVSVESTPQRLEQHLTVAFETSLHYSVRRTETFIPYLFGKAMLFEDKFDGSGVFLRENASSNGKKTVVERTFGVVASTLGKLLGF